MKGIQSFETSDEKENIASQLILCFLLSYYSIFHVLRPKILMFHLGLG